MPKECTCTDVDGIEDIPAAEMTSELFKERLAKLICSGEIYKIEYLQISEDQQTSCSEKCLPGLGGDEGSGLLLAEGSVHQQ